jgi:HTH-type transcriptional regulator, transcriptional repressor of NAD biosynthesis genes
MNRGLVIGKFMPVHAGHLALIEFAASQCNELIVSLSYTEHDPIPSAKRIEWLTELVSHNKKIKVGVVVDDFDRDDLPFPERTKIWADVLQKKYPTINTVFSSEPYGVFLAQHLQAQNIAFDPNRSKFPVSATAIRNNPARNWSFIPATVRPYFVKLVCLYGPESTGKSTLAKRLAEHYQTEWVPEVAREMITSNDFSMDDIIAIGQEQTERIKSKLKTVNKVLICDTDLITTQIYSQKYLNAVPPVLIELEKEIQYDLYCLLDIDVAWVADGLRDLGNQRKEMFAWFKAELDIRNIPYKLISGDYASRESQLIKSIDSLLQGGQPG